MRFFAVLCVLTSALILTGCSKEESKPAPQPSMDKPAETSNAMQQAEQAVQQSKEKLAQMAEQAKETATQVSEQAEEKVAQVTEQAKKQVAKLEEKVQAAMPMGTTDLSLGKTVYNKTCFACHKLGLAGAPKIGDKAAWAPRIADGEEELVTNAIKGTGAMPAKGGNAKLTDAEVRAAVDYMVEQSR